MDPQLLRQASFDKMVTLPVDDPVVTIPSLFVTKSYPYLDSPMYEGFPSISPLLDRVVVPDTPFSPLDGSFNCLAFFVMKQQSIRAIFDAIFIIGHLETTSLCFSTRARLRTSDRPFPHPWWEPLRHWGNVVVYDDYDDSGISLVHFDTVMTETQLIPGDDSIVAEMEFEYASKSSIEVHPMSIETKVGLYLSTLKMMAIFLPIVFGKDDVDSPCYPALAEIKDFLPSTTSQGWFDIISLNGSFIVNESGGTKSRSGGMSVALVAPDGRIIAGGLAGLLVAASPVQVIVGTFLHGHQRDKEQEPTIKKTRTPGLSAVPTSLFSGHTNITFGSGFEISYNDDQNNNLNFSPPANPTHGSNSKEVNPTHCEVSC